jgi:hypothetical protein
MRAPIPLIALLVAASAAFTSPACDAQQSTQTTPNALEKRIKICDTQASSKKLEGDARVSFMSECLEPIVQSTGEQSAPQRRCPKELRFQMRQGAIAKAFGGALRMN